MTSAIASSSRPVQANEPTAAAPELVANTHVPVFYRRLQNGMARRKETNGGLVILET